MLECPGCGAPAAPESLDCDHCHARLQTIACPSCFGMMFLGAKHCSHCGAEGARAEVAGGERPCPRCRAAMSVTAVGESFLEECSGCGGVWVDARSFEKIVASREQQAAYVGLGSPSAEPQRSTPEQTVRYVPCPSCDKVMNRINFARSSGVIVDVCKGHGVWFDRDELRRIVEFIRSGGLERAHEQEAMHLADERRRLESERRLPPLDLPPAPDHEGVLHAVRGLLSFLWD
jgi:Zn-finger nucleic acid-binding protein